MTYFSSAMKPDTVRVLSSSMRVSSQGMQDRPHVGFGQCGTKEKEAQRQKAEYDGKNDESGGISNPEHAHRVTKWVIISIPEVANPIDAMTIASPVTLHMKHAQRTHVMASMMLAFFSKFLYVFIVVSFILCGHIQYNM